MLYSPELRGIRRTKMIWKNPFLSKNSEQQFREDQFLSLFDCTALQIIEPENLEKVSFVSSTPGAGKTTLFRAFLPEVLSRVIVPEIKSEHKEFYHHMERLGVIMEGTVRLASISLSCARGYTIIDEMFQNGRRKQIFFALLNYRITIALLKSIGRVLDLVLEDYSRIEFVQIPQEMLYENEHLKNGRTLYEWACQGERQLCKYLDSERNENIEISFVHTTLLLIKLFEPGNILIDGDVYFNNVLIIFDDFHKLSENQKKGISEAIYTLKSNIGVWFGQRFEGLGNEQLISMDGSLNRDYNPNIVIDNYWPNKMGAFNNMLEQIANKRVKAASLENFLKFSDCISERIEIQNYAKRIKEFIKKENTRIEISEELSDCYHDILSFLSNDHKMDLIEKAVWYECIIIRENRRHSGQLSLFGSERLAFEEFESFVKDNRGAAFFYISRKMNIPYYYGFDSLKNLSSYNIEQFLFFAAPLLECYRIKTLEATSRRNKRLTPQEQEDALKKSAKKKWDDMDFRYTNIKEIKEFLNGISDFCVRSRNSERNSYAGGAYTGVGINKVTFMASINQTQYIQLREILGACLASKYLERREINNGEIIVFYLNRWLCLYYDLPLAYGGWRRCGIDTLLSLCKKTDGIKNKDQYKLEDFGV